MISQLWQKIAVVPFVSEVSENDFYEASKIFHVCHNKRISLYDSFPPYSSFIVPFSQLSTLEWHTDIIPLQLASLLLNWKCQCGIADSIVFDALLELEVQPFKRHHQASSTRVGKSCMMLFLNHLGCLCIAPSNSANYQLF